MGKSIVLVHGNFVNNTSWAAWESYFREKGYTVYAPANPGHDGEPAALRKNIHPRLAETGFVDLVNDLVKFIDQLPEKPLIIGHSMGGLVTKKLIELGKGVAGVSIDGAPPKNIFPPFSTLKIVLPAFGFFSVKNYFLGSRDWYNRAFFNTLGQKEKEEAYDRVAVPESLKVNIQAVFNSFANIDFSKPHVPLLFIGGGSDAIFPPSLTRRIAGSYSDKASKADVKIFEGRSHYICGEKGWQEVADYILHWYEQLP